MPTTCAVLGSPIAHSLSPALHRAAYTELGLDWTYERHQVDEGRLAGFVAGCGPHWRGLSLTMPLKTAALALGEPDPVVELVGAANTLIFDGTDSPDGTDGADGIDGGGAGRRRLLYNTDVAGMVDAVRSVGVQQVRAAVLIGSGATARSALVSLAHLECERITVVARNPQRVEELRPLAGQLGVDLHTSGWDAPLPAAELLVSTVVKGAADRFAGQLADVAPVVFDVVYDPWPTALAAAASEHGAVTLSGLDLLVHQAVGQLRLMTGESVPPQVLLSAGRAELHAAGHR